MSEEYALAIGIIVGLMVFIVIRIIIDLVYIELKKIEEGKKDRLI